MNTASRSTVFRMVLLTIGTVITVFIGALVGFTLVFFAENALIHSFDGMLTLPYPQLQILAGILNIAVGGILIFYVARSFIRNIVSIRQQPASIDIVGHFINAFLIGMLISMCSFGIFVLFINLPGLLP